MQTPRRFETTCMRLCVFFPLPLSPPLWHGQKEWKKVERAFSCKPPVAAGPHLAVRCQVRGALSFHLARPKSGLMCLSERVPQCCDLSLSPVFAAILCSSTWDNCSLIGWQEMKTVSTLCGIISFLLEPAIQRGPYINAGETVARSGLRIVWRPVS